MKVNKTRQFLDVSQNLQERDKKKRERKLIKPKVDSENINKDD